jgi:hypothetical protein
MTDDATCSAVLSPVIKKLCVFSELRMNLVCDVCRNIHRSSCKLFILSDLQ